MDDATAFVYRFPDRIEYTAGAGVTLHWPDGTAPFNSLQPIRINRNVRSLYVVRQAFLPAECEQIVALGSSLLEVAGVYDGDRADRDSRIGWIEPIEEAQWIFHRLAALFAEANRQYGFALTGFAEALQYTEYGVDGHFDWHLDIGPDEAAARKLSVSILLNSPAEYDGGDLEFLRMGGPPPDLEAGTAIFFPAYLPHRVAPVSGGLRRSLVAWAYGDSFR